MRISFSLSVFGIVTLASSLGLWHGGDLRRDSVGSTVAHNVAPCDYCDATLPSSPVPASWITITYSNNTPKKGECLENDQGKCDQLLKKCQFYGYVYLTEVNTGAAVTPSPMKGQNVPWGWELISMPGAQKRWKAFLGTDDAGKLVDCCDVWDELKFTYTPPPPAGGGPTEFKLSFCCAKCEDQQCAVPTACGGT